MSGTFDRVLGRQHLNVIQRLVPACSIGVAAIAASMFLFGELQVTEAQISLDLGTAQQAARFLPAWPRTASVMARAWLLSAAMHGHDNADHQKSRDWLLVAVRRDDTDPSLWNDLAEFDAALGAPGDALTEYHSALRLDPTSARAMSGLSRLARDRCDLDGERYWQHRASQIVSDASSRAPVREPWQNQAPSCSDPGHR
jgi:predicted Zn-dependent protease